MEIELTQIKPNPFQPRKSFDPDQLASLSKSILEMGVLQPIVVRRKEDHFEIVAGERRYRASVNAGLSTIPSLVREFSDVEMAAMSLVENLQRADLNYFEEAEAYQKLISEFSLTQEEVAKRVGKSQSTVANKLRILKIAPEVRKNIMVDILTERHVRALLKLRDVPMQLRALKLIYENDMNVQQSEILISDMIESEEMVLRPDDPLTKVPKEKRRKIIRVIKDIRIYLNSIKAAVQSIEEAGIQVKMSEKNFEDYVEVKIQIPKAKKESGQ
jgi:ParB family chromosome partitioning protein